MHISTLLFVQLVLLLGALTNAEVINFDTCEPADVQACTINEVRVNPCPQAAQHAPCHIRRRHQHIMSFDFTPNFDSDTLYADLVWVRSDDQELPLASMVHDGCFATKCPVKNGVRQTYEIDLPVERKFPISSYKIKWTLKEPSQGKRCCFLLDIKVTR